MKKRFRVQAMETTVFVFDARAKNTISLRQARAGSVAISEIILFIVVARPLKWQIFYHFGAGFTTCARDKCSWRVDI